MSNDDEIGEKSDMTRIEDLSEFLHQDDPEVNAAFQSEDDEPPSTDSLPDLDDLEDDEEVEFETTSFDNDDQEDDEEEIDFNTEFESDDDEDSEEDSQEDDGDSFNFSSENEDDQEDDSSDFETSTDFGALDNSDNDDDEEDDENSFGDFDSSNDFSSTSDFSSEVSFENDDEEDTEEDEDNNDQEFSSSFDSEEDDEEEDEDDFNNDIEEDQAPEIISPPTPPIATATYIDRSEKFEDVKSFAKNITYGKIASGGNPPFSIILRNVKFEEDVEDILIILNEHELVGESSEDQMRQSLEGGSLLISQISEFAAIYLTHKFRRFDLDVQMGLSDELHPSKSYESDSVGLISKSRINQNKSETNRIDKSKVNLEGIIISTTPTLENYKIVEYLGIVSDFIIVSEDELTNDEELSEYHERVAKGHVDQEDSEEDISEIDLKISQSVIYSDLSEKLKPICIKKNGNAIVGINYQITPLSDGSKYKISCSGSAVWIIDSN
ncbi:hypothetical protein [Halobacteriovorax sp. JY17]|uniref:hypothetical protein n=1 Tax=Halobacteriovorax sp. JY17 TaxID=2014617 RepID=UPI000C616757|nr:hypothetical protein [Halobacteriovorax sp. JY17]PIK15500.1 MAG: hypothetical protein CES88_01910 [Halobacteriovorax sp. JY17]